jgi:amino acid transporter
MLGNVGVALGSAAPTASIALTLAAIVAASSYASPIAILVIGLPMLGIAAAFKRLNRWHVNCGATYQWGARAISPYYGFMVGWLIFLAYFVGVISICLPIGPYLISLFGNVQSRLGEAIIGSAAVIAVTIVAYIGIRVAAWVQWALSPDWRSARSTPPPSRRRQAAVLAAQIQRPVAGRGWRGSLRIRRVVTGQPGLSV